jgi:glycosyltransferase A (GT-A) superfamily protein (DUF2064 family)
MDSTNRKALVIFSKPPELGRRTPDEPYAGLPWTDLDSLFFAMLDDLIETANEIESTDIYILRFNQEFSGDFLTRFGTKVQVLDLPTGSSNDAIHFAFETMFGKMYEHVLLLLEPHPLITKHDLITAFEMFHFDDDCVVIGQHLDGNYFLIGLKSYHTDLFDSDDGGEQTKQPSYLLERLCNREVMVFPMLPKYSLDSGTNLYRLKYELEELAGGNGFSKRTRAMFKTIDKKYKIRRPH